MSDVVCLLKNRGNKLTDLSKDLWFISWVSHSICWWLLLINAM